MKLIGPTKIILIFVLQLIYKMSPCNGLTGTKLIKGNCSDFPLVQSLYNRKKKQCTTLNSTTEIGKMKGPQSGCVYKCVGVKFGVLEPNGTFKNVDKFLKRYVVDSLRDIARNKTAICFHNLATKLNLTDETCQSDNNLLGSISCIASFVMEFCSSKINQEDMLGEDDPREFSQ